MRSVECTREVDGWRITLDFLMPTYCRLFHVPLFVEQVEKAFIQRGSEVREEIPVSIEMAIWRDEKYRLNSGGAGFTHTNSIRPKPVVNLLEYEGFFLEVFG